MFFRSERSFEKNESSPRAELFNNLLGLGIAFIGAELLSPIVAYGAGHLNLAPQVAEKSVAIATRFGNVIKGFAALISSAFAIKTGAETTMGKFNKGAA